MEQAAQESSGVCIMGDFLEGAGVASVWGGFSMTNPASVPGTGLADPVGY